MPTEQEILEAAYHHFEHWSTERQQFDALLDPDVHWVETDLDLGPGDYHGKAAVMAHLDFIQQQGATTTLKSVSQQKSGWQTRDNMKVQGVVHCCINDIDFTGGLISHVIHCKGHAQNAGKGPCA
jgi:hypothetical protein